MIIIAEYSLKGLWHGDPTVLYSPSSERAAYYHFSTLQCAHTSFCLFLSHFILPVILWTMGQGSWYLSDFQVKHNTYWKWKYRSQYFPDSHRGKNWGDLIFKQLYKSPIAVLMMFLSSEVIFLYLLGLILSSSLLLLLCIWKSFGMVSPAWLRMDFVAEKSQPVKMVTLSANGEVSLPFSGLNVLTFVSLYPLCCLLLLVMRHVLPFKAFSTH